MIYLLLGTDMGDRDANLSLARELIAKALGVDLLCSAEIETEAIGFDGPAFLNQVVAFDGEFEPYDLLHRCQGIEMAMGRKPHKACYDNEGRRIYEPRIIDIDILHLNGVVMDEPELRIPHMQVEERPFVKELLRQLPQYKELSNN
jgi:2-amino-4-hydroxy-6-hydroxymethyldihydropteridine diphosphokinase